MTPDKNSNLLLTGFEPFGGLAGNPSAELVERLHGSRIGGLTVHGAVLPVINTGLRRRLIELIDYVEPAFVLSLGLASGETMIRIEKLAVNYSRFDIPDNAGEQLHEPVVSGGQDVYAATLPVQRLQQVLLARGIPARLSNSAGTYLCNALMYHALDYSANTTLNCACGFVHLPLSPVQVCNQLAINSVNETRTDLASMDMELQLLAVTELISVLAEDIKPSLMT